MYYKALFSFFFAMCTSVAVAKWEKVNDIDYTWGPFKIYNIALFTETGEFKLGSRPVMLTLKYSKPVDGRDFAISVAKSWVNLGIELPNQEVVIDRLRKTLPDLKPDDVLNYIALEDRGYFVLNDQVIDQEFEREFNDAMLAVWLDPKVEFSHKLANKKVAGAEQEVHHSLDYPQSLEEISIEPQKEKSPIYLDLNDAPAYTTQAVDSEQQSTKLETTKAIKSVNVPKVIEPVKNAEIKESALVEKEKAEPISDAENTKKEIKLPETDSNQSKEKELENPEKEILPEMDPIPVSKLTFC